MSNINDIYEAIDVEGFSKSTLHLIDEYINDIENGRTNFSRFNEQEHAGLCKAGAVVIGASVVASYARRSITASCHAEGREGQCQPRAEVSSPKSYVWSCSFN